MHTKRFFSTLLVALLGVTGAWAQHTHEYTAAFIWWNDCECCTAMLNFEGKNYTTKSSWLNSMPTKIHPIQAQVTTPHSTIAI